MERRREGETVGLGDFETKGKAAGCRGGEGKGAGSWVLGPR